MGLSVTNPVLLMVFFARVAGYLIVTPFQHICSPDGTKPWSKFAQKSDLEVLQILIEILIKILIEISDF